MRPNSSPTNPHFPSPLASSVERLCWLGPMVHPANRKCFGISFTSAIFFMVHNPNLKC